MSLDLLSLAVGFTAGALPTAALWRRAARRALHRQLRFAHRHAVPVVRVLDTAGPPEPPEWQNDIACPHEHAEVA